MPIFDVIVTYNRHVDEAEIWNEIPKRFRVSRVGSIREIHVDCHNREEADLLKVSLETVPGVHVAIPDTPSTERDLIRRDTNVSTTSGAKRACDL